MKLEVLEKNKYYHVYNRGINGCNIFNSNENKLYFLKLATKHLKNNVDIVAYCLMENHYHFLIQVKDDTKKTTQAFSNFFNAYSKAFNKQNQRTGSLFEKHFKRKKIDSEDYFKKVFCYIHLNPKTNWENYNFSSYQSYLDNKQHNTIYLEKSYVLNLFDNIENLETVHHSYKNISKIDSKEISDLQGFENLAGRKLQFNKLVKDKFYNYIQQLQDTITSKLEAIDGKAKFQEDLWKRSEGGGGRTRVIENGNVFEKGGVNISAVHGALPKSMQAYFGVKDADFFACGLSLVLHPKNPMVPTVHANWRYFEMYPSTALRQAQRDTLRASSEKEIIDQWFGGGQDLTPYYLFEEDAKHFHQTCKTACDEHNIDFYPKYKARCDEYFHNAHRNEARGIGGLFFDYCKANDQMTMENWYDFVTEVGDSFLEAYVPIVEKRKDLPYTQEQRDWQEIRRGRYVEFNLVHDKGTLFGLKTNGRIESILMSLPPHVQWVYDHHPEKGSDEEKLINILQNPREWV